MDRLRLSLFVVGFLLMAATAWITHGRIRLQQEDAEAVYRSYRVLRKIEGLRASLASAESARRALSSTGDESFRHLLEPERRAAKESHAALLGLTQDHPDQQKDLSGLQEDLERRLAQLGRPAGREAPEEHIRRIEEGRALSARLSTAVSRVEERERLLLSARDAEAKAGVISSTRAAVLSGSAGMGVILAGILLFLQEVRRRRRSEGDLREAYRRTAEASAELRAFFDGSMDLTGIADLDGTFKRVNPSWTAILGWTPEEVVGRPWLDFVHPDDRQATIDAAGGLAQGKPAVQFLNRYRTRDGGWRWISWNTPAPEPGSTFLFAIGRDVTERKLGEDRLRELNARLEEANKELEAFSYSVSHDLRAPLRHINGFVELLEKRAGASLDEVGRRHLRTISDSTSRMGRLIDDLLGFSRTGRAELRPSRVSMDGVVAEVWRSLASEREGREIRLEARPLPDAQGDPGLLHQVWMNLLSNAVKYTRDAPRALVEVDAVPMNGRGTVFRVRDNGAGFDMAYAGKLFGVFQRLHGPKEFEGTGIGLANVKRIIVRHGGSVWAEGKVGEGAVFHFTLPLAEGPRR
jgi:PAS domain S-box-containing protein